MTSSPLQLRLAPTSSFLIPPAQSYLLCFIPPLLYQSLSHQRPGHLPWISSSDTTQGTRIHPCARPNDGITLIAIPINETIQIQAPGSSAGPIAFNPTALNSVNYPHTGLLKSQYRCVLQVTNRNDLSPPQLLLRNVHNSRQDLCPPRWRPGDIRAPGVLLSKRRTQPVPLPHSPQIPRTNDRLTKLGG